MAIDRPSARGAAHVDATGTAVVFDVDGTLLDVSDRYLEGYRRAAATFGLDEPAPHKIRQHKSRGCSGRQILAAIYPTIDEGVLVRLDRARARLTGAPDLQLLDRPVPGALATLRRLREEGVGIAFVTLRPARANGVLTGLGISVAGDVIVNAATRDKSQSLAKAADLLRVAARQCVAVGDAPDDVVAARRAGMLPVAVSYGLVGAQRLRQETPSAVIDDLHSLLPLLGLEQHDR